MEVSTVVSSYNQPPLGKQAEGQGRSTDVAGEREDEKQGCKNSLS